MNNREFSLALTIIEYIKIFLIMWGICSINPKKKVLPYIYSIIPCIVLLYLLSNYLDTETTVIAGLILGEFISISIFTDTFGRKLILHAVIAVMSSLVNVYISTIVGMFKTVDNEYFFDTQFFDIACNLVILPILLVIVIVRILGKRERRIESFSMVWKQYLILIVGVICCYAVIDGTQSVLLGLVDEQQSTLVFVIVNGACMIFFLISIWQIRVTSSRNYYKNRDEFQQKYIDMQAQQFAGILEKENQLRSFRHDLRSHMIAIKELSERKDYDNLEVYTQRILDEVASLKRYNFSGNSVVDAVISDIMKNCQESNINIDWKGQLPAEINIDRFDLCTIFSNIIKNAIEACLKIEQLEQRKICIYTSMYEGVLSIRESNPIGKSVKMLDGKPMTDKADKDMHGYGTSNIAKCVKKYNGVVNYNISNEEFVIEIVMHQR